MVTFLVQKKMIKFGLKDKSFLENKVSTKPFVKDKVEEKLLAPEEEKKNKELKVLLEAIQANLYEDKFDEACVNFSKIKHLKTYEWFEVCGMWTYIVKKRNTRYAKIVLDLISKNNFKSMDDMGLNNQKIKKTKSKINSIYGHSRLASVNPYEIYDHKSVSNELVTMASPQPEPLLNLAPLSADLVFKPFDSDAFKGPFR